MKINHSNYQKQNLILKIIVVILLLFIGGSLAYFFFYQKNIELKGKETIVNNPQATPDNSTENNFEYNKWENYDLSIYHFSSPDCQTMNTMQSNLQYENLNIKQDSDITTAYVIEPKQIKEESGKYYIYGALSSIVIVDSNKLNRIKQGSILSLLGKEYVVKSVYDSSIGLKLNNDYYIEKDYTLLTIPIIIPKFQSTYVLCSFDPYCDIDEVTTFPINKNAKIEIDSSIRQDNIEILNTYVEYEKVPLKSMIRKVNTREYKSVFFLHFKENKVDEIYEIYYP